MKEIYSFDIIWNLYKLDNVWLKFVKWDLNKNYVVYLFLKDNFREFWYYLVVLYLVGLNEELKINWIRE